MWAKDVLGARVALRLSVRMSVLLNHQTDFVQISRDGSLASENPAVLALFQNIYSAWLQDPLI